MRHEFVPVRKEWETDLSGRLFGPDYYPKGNEERLKRYIYIYISVRIANFETINPNQYRPNSQQVW